MWIDCPSCGGRGSNGVEDPCLSCGGRGVVFRECCGCRDCKEKVDADGNCAVEDCPKDHDVLPAGDKHPMEEMQ